MTPKTYRHKLSLWIVVTFLWALLLPLSLDAETVTLTEAGTLASQLGDKLNTITELTVTGPINADDIAAIKQASTSSSLVTVDMGGATIEGGIFPESGMASTKITNMVLPGNVSAIADMAFMDCRSLSAVKLPETLRTIGQKAFKNTGSLRSIVLPEGLTSIGEEAFANLVGLDYVILPSTIEYIGHRGLAISSLLSIYSKATQAPEGLYSFDVKGSNSGIYEGTPVIIPQGSKDSYASSQSWNFLPLIEMPADLLPDPEYTAAAHMYNGEPISDILGDRLADLQTLILFGTLSEADFSSLSNAATVGALQNLNIVQVGIENDAIPSEAFSGTKLRSIILPGSVKAIESSAFSNCKQLEFVRLPAALETIGQSAFANDRALEYIELPESLKYVGDCAFEFCIIENAVVPENLEYIGYRAFYGTKLSGSITISGNCELGRAAFAWCNIEKAVVEEGLTELPMEAFQLCLFLKELQLPTSLRVVNTCAISNNISMTEIFLPEGVERIEVLALYNNYLTKVFSLPSTLTYIGYQAFMGDKRAETIYCRAVIPPVCGLDDIGNTPFNIMGDLSLSVPEHIPVYVPIGSGELYRADPCWSYFVNIIETDEFPESGLEEAAVVRPAADGMMYNLQGMPVTNPQPGNIYIVNGKKVRY